MVAAIRYLGGDLMREGITCSLGPDPCINHALIGIAGARFGNGRLILPAGWPCTPVYRISGPGLSLEFYNVSIPSGIGLVHSAPDDTLFLLKVNNG
jgi:hypothetical protein